MNIQTLTMECKGTLHSTSQSLAWGRNHHHISPSRSLRLGSHICSPCRESTTCLDCQSWSSFPGRVQHCYLFPGVQKRLNDTVKTCVQLSVKQLTTGDISMTRTWPHNNCVTRTWQEHDKSMTRAWQEHGENMTRAWQYDKNITDVNHAFIMIFEIHMFFQAMNQVSHAPTSFTPITSLPPEAKFNSWNTCLGVSKTWGTTSRQTSKLSNLKAENLTNFQTVWGASLPESLSSSRHNQTRHRKRSSPTQVTTWNKT